MSTTLNEEYDEQEAYHNATRLSLRPQQTVKLTRVLDYRKLMPAPDSFQVQKIKAIGSRAYIATMGCSQVVMTDLKTGTVLGQARFKQILYPWADAAINDIAVDSRYVYAAAGDAGVKVLDPADLKLVKTIAEGQWACAVAVDKNRLYVGDNSHQTVYVYDIDSGEQIDSFTIPDRMSRGGHIYGIMLHQDRLFLFGGGPFITFDLKTRKFHRFPWLKGPQFDGFIVNIPALVYDGIVHGNELWVTDQYHGIGIWNLNTENLVTYLQTEPEKLYCSGLDMVDNTVITGNGWGGIIEFPLPNLI